MIHAISLEDITKYHSTLWCVGQLVINQLYDFPGTKLCPSFILPTSSIPGRWTKSITYAVLSWLVVKNVSGRRFVWYALIDYKCAG